MLGPSPLHGQTEVSSCGEQRRARVSAALKQCVLLMRAGLEDAMTSGQWENGKDSRHLPPPPGVGLVRLRGMLIKPFSGLSVNIDNEYSSVTRHIYGLKTAPLQTLLLVRLAKSASLIDEYTIRLDSLFT